VGKALVIAGSLALELFRGPSFSTTSCKLGQQHPLAYQDTSHTAEMPVSKATKKFQKDKLGDVIKRRKDVVSQLVVASTIFKILYLTAL
jgi:hypothetical protein